MAIRVTTSEYEKMKIEFLKAHEDWTVNTSPMDEYGRYHKEYICSNDDVWYEINEPHFETAEAEVEVKGIKVKLSQEVKLLRTEGFCTTRAGSIICYEKF